jgi:hypothetical protein
VKGLRRAQRTSTVGAPQGSSLTGVGIFNAREEWRDPAGDDASVPAKQKETINSGALLLGLHEKVLEIEQRLLRRLHVDKRRGNSRLARTSRTSDLMNVVLLNAFRMDVSPSSPQGRVKTTTHLDLLGHGEIDNVLNLGEIESLGRDGTGNHDVLLARLERLDRIFSLFLSCESRMGVSKRRANTRKGRGRNVLLLP